jgi:hypothetical protein
VSGYLRDIGHRPEPPARDPMGKAALFAPAAETGARDAGPARVADARRPGTVLIECSACGQSTRVSYVGFATGCLPFSIWLPPLPALWYNRRMTCPACGQWTWVRAHWLA